MEGAAQRRGPGAQDEEMRGLLRGGGPWEVAAQPFPAPSDRALS